MGVLKDITGQKFGRLTVIELSPRKGGHTSWWWCKCDCGNIVEVGKNSLTSGNTKSCGCYGSEKARERGRQMLTKHGWYGTKLYHIWKNMVERCEKPYHSQYANYGERGISVAKEWRNSPKAFCEWAIANGYEDNLTIDRIDPNGNYEPNNCRWITMGEQQTNKRNNVNITYNGKTQCVAEWARELGLIQHRLYARVKAGWTNPQEILFGKQKGEIYG